MIMSKLFKKTLFIIIVLFGVIALTIAISSGWNIYNDLTQEYKSKGTVIAKSIAGSSVETLLNRDASTVQAMIDQWMPFGLSWIFRIGFAPISEIAFRFAGHFLLISIHILAVRRASSSAR